MTTTIHFKIIYFIPQRDNIHVCQDTHSSLASKYKVYLPFLALVKRRQFWWTMFILKPGRNAADPIHTNSSGRGRIKHIIFILLHLSDISYNMQYQ